MCNSVDEGTRNKFQSALYELYAAHSFIVRITINDGLPKKIKKPKTEIWLIQHKFSPNYVIITMRIVIDDDPLP